MNSDTISIPSFSEKNIVTVIVHLCLIYQALFRKMVNNGGGGGGGEVTVPCELKKWSPMGCLFSYIPKVHPTYDRQTWQNLKIQNFHFAVKYNIRRYSRILFFIFIYSLPCPHSGAGYYIATVSSSFFFFFFLLLLSVNMSISQRPYVRLCSYLVTITSLRTRTFDMTSFGV